MSYLPLHEVNNYIAQTTQNYGTKNPLKYIKRKIFCNITC